MQSTWNALGLPVALPLLSVCAVHEENGRQVFRWNPGETVAAVAYDNPIPGFQTNNTINLRLWAAKPDREFDLQAFNTGDYVQVGGPGVSGQPRKFRHWLPPGDAE